MTIGKKIERYRKRYKFSQEELASKLYVSRQTISQWENDQTSPTVDNFLRLCEVFGISMNDFFESKAVARDPSLECDEFYDWRYSEDELRGAFGLIRKRENIRWAIVFVTNVFLLILGLCFQLHTLCAAVLYSGIVVITCYLIIQYMYKKNCEKAISVILGRIYRVGVENSTVLISVFDAQGTLISLDRIYPINVERVWDSDDLYIIQYKQRRYMIKKKELKENSLIGNLLGFSN